MKDNMKQDAGFTLMELAITVAIFAVLAAIAIPNMIAWRNNAAHRGAVNTLSGDLAMAKQSAVRNNCNVVVDFSADGYLIYIDNGDGTADADADDVPDGMNNSTQDGTERALRDRDLAPGVAIDLAASTFAGNSTLFDRTGRCPAAVVGQVVVTGANFQNTIAVNRLGRITVN